MGIFFMFDTCVGALAYGMAYFKTPAAWINIMAIAATGASFFVGDTGVANPRVLRILRTVRAVAKVGLVKKSWNTRNSSGCRDAARDGPR